MLDLDWIRDTLKEAIEDENWDLVREVIAYLKDDEIFDQYKEDYPSWEDQNNFNNTILSKEDAYNDKLKNICTCVESDKINVFNDSSYIDLNRQIYSLSSSSKDNFNYSITENNANKLTKLKNERILIRDSLRQECFKEIKNILNNDSIPIPKNLRTKLLVQGSAVILDIKTMAMK